MTNDEFLVWLSDDGDANLWATQGATPVRVRVCNCTVKVSDVDKEKSPKTTDIRRYEFKRHPIIESVVVDWGDGKTGETTVSSLFVSPEAALSRLRERSVEHYEKELRKIDEAIKSLQRWS